MIGAAEEGSVWCRGESCLHFLLSGIVVVRLLAVVIFYRFQSNIQLVTLRHGACGGTRRGEESDGTYEKCAEGI